MSAIHGDQGALYLAPGAFAFLLKEDGGKILQENGRGLLLESSVTSDVAVPVVQLTDWSIDFNQVLVDRTLLSQQWKSFVKGLQQFSGDFAGNYDVTDTTLWTASTDTSGKPVRFYLYPQNSSRAAYYGTCWVKLGKIADDGVGKKATNTVHFDGDGTPSAGIVIFWLQKEDGGFLLQENGGHLILEP